MKQDDRALEKYNECCICDIDSAVQCGYPKRLLHKLYLRKGQCFYHLKENDEALKVFLESRQSVKDAQFDSGKCDEFNKEIDKWIKQVASSLGNTKSDNQVSVPKVTHGTSPVLVNASSVMELHNDEDKGRHILAARDICVGDVLIVEKPYAAVLLPDHYNTHCHHCFHKFYVWVPCASCVQVKYCSFECAKVSWEKYHKWECGLLNLLHSIGIAHLCLRVILVSGLNFLLEFKKTYIEDKHGNNERIAGVNKDGMYRCDYLAVYELLPHINKMNPADILQYALTAELLLTCLQFKEFFGGDNIGEGFENLKLETTLPRFEKNSREIFIGNLLLRHMCQLVCNAHAITAVQVSDSVECASELMCQEQVRIATAIYPTTSLLNHSCDPTIINSFDKDTLVVRAIKSVPQGGEIFNCYGPHFKRMPRFKRQEILREQYFFKCRCQPCEEGERTEMKYQALKCDACEGPLIFKPPNPDHTCLECGQKTKALNEMKQVLNSKKLFTRGCTLMQTGNIQGAINFLEKCQSIRAKTMYKYHRELAEVNDSLAKCYAGIGLYEKSVKYLAESTEANKVIYGQDSIEYGHELQKYSEVLCNARKLTEAFQTATRAEEIFSMHYGDNHELVVEIRDYLRKLQLITTY